MSNPIRLLIVDDHPVVRDGLRGMLSGQPDFEVLGEAADGLQAVALTAQLQPDVVLMDLRMPRMNGFEMLAELRKDSALSSAVVFVLTTSKADEDKVEAYQHHVAGYIIKSQVGDGFLRIMEMLDHYWRVVELPVER